MAEPGFGVLHRIGAAACRRTRPGLALLGLVLVLLGAAAIVSANAALPMLDLGRSWAGADASERLVLEGAAGALLARGAHGGLGVLPAFLLSEVGTLVACLGMRGGPFGRVVPWLGVAGIGALAACTLAVTFVPGAAGAMVALAAPGGLLMIAWYARMGWKLWGLGREG